MRLTAQGTSGECNLDGNVCCPDDNCPQECIDQRIYKLQEYENVCYAPDGEEFITPAQIAEYIRYTTEGYILAHPQVIELFTRITGVGDIKCF